MRRDTVEKHLSLAFMNLKSNDAKKSVEFKDSTKQTK